MSILDGIEKFTDDGGQRLPFLNTGGSYVLSFKKMEDKTTFAEGVPYLKTTVEVVESKGEGANPPGSQAVIMIKKRKHNMHLRDVKALAGAIVGIDPSQVDGALITELMDEKDASAVGTKFRCDVTLESKDGASFPVSRYYPVTEEPKAKGKASKN